MVCWWLVPIVQPLFYCGSQAVESENMSILGHSGRHKVSSRHAIATSAAVLLERTGSIALFTSRLGHAGTVTAAIVSGS